MWLGGYADEVFLRKVANDEHRVLELVEVGDKYIGFFDLDIVSGCFSFYVEPNSRGRGYAKEIVEKVIAAGQGMGLTKLRAGVEKDNLVSQKVLERAGFIKILSDEDGILNFEKRL